MGSFIDGAGITEVFAPCADAYDSAFSVMVICAEECVEGVCTAIQSGVLHCQPSMPPVFS